MHRIPHGTHTDRAAALVSPSLDSLAKQRIGIALRVSEQPLEVHSPWIVAAPRFGLHVICFALPPQQTTDRCQANTEHIGRLFVGACLARPVGRNNTSAKIQ